MLKCSPDFDMEGAVSELVRWWEELSTEELVRWWEVLSSEDCGEVDSDRWRMAPSRSCEIRFMSFFRRSRSCVTSFSCAFSSVMLLCWWSNSSLRIGDRELGE